MNPVIEWCELFHKAQRATPDVDDETIAFALASKHRTLALSVMEHIGSFPTSEPELRSLQKIWPI